MPVEQQNTLELLLAETNIIKKGELEEAFEIAKDLNLSLDRALIMSGFATEESMKLPLEAQAMVESGQLTFDVAVKALRLASQAKIALKAAVQNLNRIHTKTQVTFTLTNELTALLLSAGIITSEQLGRAVMKAAETGMMMGRTLQLHENIPMVTISSALSAVLMIRENQLTKEQAIPAMKEVHKRKICLEQALFELRLFTQPKNESFRIGELFYMAGLVSDLQLVECLEIEVFKQKQFGQILLEEGLVTPPQLENAVLLQDSVASDKLKAYQAAAALKRVCQSDVSIYQAMAEAASQSVTERRLGDLLTDASICSREQIEAAVGGQQVGSIKIGKMLMDSQLISPVVLYSALRCQSLLLRGFISIEDAVAAVKYCHENAVIIDVAFQELGMNLPTRMQWTWV